MGLEAANNFNELDKTWPLLGDSMKQTGGHIRLLKKVLKQIFPGTSGQGFAIPIESTEVEWNHCVGLTAPVQPQLDKIKGNAILVSGFIPYSGTFSNIPTNYQLCDGTNGTPDLTNRFIMGTTVQGDIGQTGGSADKIVPAHSHSMDHNHSVVLALDGEHDHDIDATSNTSTNAGAGLNIGSNAVAILATNKTTSDGVHSHLITIDNKVLTTSTDGAVAIGANNPAYIKLAFIMRIS